MSNTPPGHGWHYGEPDPQQPHHGHAERPLPPYPRQPGHPGAPYGRGGSYHAGPDSRSPYGPDGPYDRQGPQDRPNPHHPYNPHGHQAPHHPQAPHPPQGETKPVGRAFLLLILLSCGALAPFVYGYAALRYWSRAAGICALITVPFVVVIVASGEDSTLGTVASGIYIVFVVLATAYLYHDLYGVNSDRAKRPRGEPVTAAPGGSAPSSAEGARKVSSNAELRARAADRAQRRKESRRLAEEDPALARELGVGRPDLQTGYDDGGLVDLNRAPAQVIAGLPGLTSEDAQALITARASAPFISLPDALIRTGLPAHLEDEISDYVVF